MSVRWLSAVVLVGLLGGCATNVPEAVRAAPPGNPMVAEVRANPQQFVGTEVRWGGTIADVKNGKTDTEIEIVDRPLESSGRPLDTDKSGGRFIARIKGFLDPVVYGRGRDFTVTGTLAPPEKRSIGEYQYTFPVVDVRAYHMWEPLLQRPYYYDPFWYYDPWFPYYRPYPWRYGPYW
jgi:outer membrane lipoprotein